jgi:hypothetical protein
MTAASHLHRPSNAARIPGFGHPAPQADIAVATRMDDAAWSELIDRWHAVAISTLDEHSNADSRNCSHCGERWPCPAVNSAALALEIHTT